MTQLAQGLHLLLRCAEIGQRCVRPPTGVAPVFLNTSRQGCASAWARGEPIAEDDPDERSDPFGTGVIEAARIAAKAAGLSRNPISILGALAALVGLAGLSYVFGLQFLGVNPGLYVGVLAYLLFPGVLVTGIFLIPACPARTAPAYAKRRAGL